MRDALMDERVGCRHWNVHSAGRHLGRLRYGGAILAADPDGSASPAQMGLKITSSGLIDIGARLIALGDERAGARVSRRVRLSPGR
jgi:hypothetical protein